MGYCTQCGHHFGHFEKYWTLKSGAVVCAGCFEKMKKHRDKLREQYELTNRLIECQTPETQQTLLEQNQALNDTDFLAMLEHRTKELAVHKQYKQANEAAALVDEVYTLRGEEPTFQKELARFYLQNNVFLCAEAVLKRFL